MKKDGNVHEQNAMLISPICTRRKAKEWGIEPPSLLDIHTPRRESRQRPSSRRSEDASSQCDLFSSPSTVNTQRTNFSFREVRKQLEKETWIQCDAVNCQKWRRVMTEEITDIGDSKWFCFLNSDPLRRSCDAEEEDYAAFDRLAQKVGVKYVYSAMPEGTIVWAKVVGYCRWPALITKDPLCGESISMDVDDEPLWYHVEFLGLPRSHGWVRSHFVTVYGHRESDKQSDRNNSLSGREGKSCQPMRNRPGRGKAKRRATLITQQKKAQLQNYKQHSVETAISEADSLLELSETDRLSSCVFTHVPLLGGSAGEPGQDLGHDSAHVAKSKTRQKTGGIKNINSSSEGPSPKQIKRKTKSCALKVIGGDQIRSGQDVKCVREAAKRKKVEDFSTNANARCDVEEEKRDYTTQANLWNFNSTLTNKSKEEKLAFDVEMYRRNEKAFEHDVRRFMERQGCRIKQLPVWQNTPISLFQLFSAVLENGGFQQVTERKRWTAVYRDLTNDSSASNGTLAKKYYAKNLWPYELFMKGKDFDFVIHRKSNKGSNTETKHVKLGGDFEKGEDDSENSDDLAAMLDSLEQESHLLNLDDEMDRTDVPGELMDLSRPKLASGVRSVDVLFYDESPKEVYSPGVKIADTASEFGQPNLPGDLPLPSLHGSDDSYNPADDHDNDDHFPADDHDNDDSGCSSDDETKELLQDLHKVQHQINLLQEEILIEE